MDRLGLLRPLILVLLGATLSGCEIVGDIFKTGVWTGVIIVIAVIAAVIFGIVKLMK